MEKIIKMILFEIYVYNKYTYSPLLSKWDNKIITIWIDKKTEFIIAFFDESKINGCKVRVVGWKVKKWSHQL